MENQKISKTSDPIFSIRVPPVLDFSTNFIYNYYVADESTNESAGVPEIYIKKSIDQAPDQLDTSSTNFSLRLPRYVELSWNSPPFRSQNVYVSTPGPSILNNLDSVATEDSFISSKYVPYTFSNLLEIENAYKDINNDGELTTSGISQATVIDNYVSNLMKSYSMTGEESEAKRIRQQLKQAIESIEKIADRPDETLGYKFYDIDGAKITRTSGFEKIVRSGVSLYSQLNALVAPDIFVSASLPDSVTSEFNSYYQSTVGKSFNVNDAVVKPIEIGPEAGDDSSFSSVDPIGYIIERYELANEGFKKTKTLVVDNFKTNKTVDTTIKYGSTYYYSIRTVARITTRGYSSDNRIHNITYYVASQPLNTNVVCDEDVAPPAPIDLNFVWDYKKNKLNIAWAMPFNSQRDIKQFQILRRKSIYEPFELLQQQSFDFSATKFQTNEVIDGNRPDMTSEESAFVKYQDFPMMMFVDEEFNVDIEMLTSSKYIYTVASVDAHGYVSNYGAQFEVIFDFFKNRLVKKLISPSGAPRPYPNLLIDTDLFKDVIRVGGASSTKMKIYFMPEYFKLQYNNGRIQKMVFTKQDESYYKMQFINLQNQKSDALKITIEDPKGLTKIDA